jgi:hypothetical protein
MFPSARVVGGGSQSRRPRCFTGPMVAPRLSGQCGQAQHAKTLRPAATTPHQIRNAAATLRVRGQVKIFSGLQGGDRMEETPEVEPYLKVPLAHILLYWIPLSILSWGLILAPVFYLFPGLVR